ncbi:MAG: redox-sensitive transcriptional activator SoxR [Gemmatimonadetes bacterium]|nr:redox-sensitive transcriptional activator SoxR [Gemmatimonadota bacterium]
MEKGKTSTTLEVKGGPVYVLCMRDHHGRYPALTVGQLAQRTGVATSALRFYENRGLIQSERTESGHRRYPRGVTRLVAFIVFAQRAGLTLEEIRVELEKLPAGRPPRGEEWARLSAVWTSRLAERIAELQRLQRGLTDCIGCGCLSLGRCQILNPGDRAAALGPGPRFWLGDAPSEPGKQRRP